MRLRLFGAAAAVLLSVGGFAVWQLRYDVDTRYYEVRVGEVQSGQDATAAFRHCVPRSAAVTTVYTTVYTTGVYTVRLRETRPAAQAVSDCIRRSSNVRYAASGHPNQR